MQLWQYCLLVTARSLYTFRSTEYCSSSHWCISWVGVVYILYVIYYIYYMKNQQDATLAVLFISQCKITLHVSDAFCVHHQEY